nr:hypothetical protein [Actinomycetota bacterium]
MTSTRGDIDGAREDWFWTTTYLAFPLGTYRRWPFVVDCFALLDES